MIVLYLPLIRRMASMMVRRLPPHMRLDDLEAAGVLGLLQATQTADPQRAEQFESYVRKKIECAMLDELRRMDLVSKEVRMLSKRIVSAMEAVQTREGVVDETSVAKEIGVSVEEYREMLERTVDIRLISLDHPSGGEDERSAVAQLQDHEPSALDTILEFECLARITTAIHRLPDKQRKILALYYLEDLNMKEISLALGLTLARVCQIHSEAIHAVRAMLEKEEN